MSELTHHADQEHDDEAATVIPEQQEHDQVHHDHAHAALWHLTYRFSVAASMMDGPVAADFEVPLMRLTRKCLPPSSVI